MYSYGGATLHGLWVFALVLFENAAINRIQRGSALCIFGGLEWMVQDAHFNRHVVCTQ